MAWKSIALIKNGVYHGTKIEIKVENMQYSVSESEVPCSLDIDLCMLFFLLFLRHLLLKKLLTFGLNVLG